jgi:hypothetical protein
LRAAGAAAAGGSAEAPSPRTAAAAACSEPNRHEAGIKASALFRPGSPIGISSSGSGPLPDGGTPPGSSSSSRRGNWPPRSRAATPLNPAAAATGGLVGSVYYAVV